MHRRILDAIDHKLNLAVSLDVGWNEHGNLLGRYDRVQCAAMVRAPRCAAMVCTAFHSRSDQAARGEL
jgi:hypothetical protein